MIIIQSVFVKTNFKDTGEESGAIPRFAIFIVTIGLALMAEIRERVCYPPPLYDNIQTKEVVFRLTLSDTFSTLERNHKVPRTVRKTENGQELRDFLQISIENRIRKSSRKLFGYIL